MKVILVTETDIRTSEEKVSVFDSFLTFRNHIPEGARAFSRGEIVNTYILEPYVWFWQSVEVITAESDAEAKS